MKNCRKEIKKEVPTLEEKHDALIYELIGQIVVPIDGFDRDARLFPVELETEATTDFRNQIVCHFNAQTTVIVKDLMRMAKSKKNKDIVKEQIKILCDVENEEATLKPFYE